MPIKSSGNTRPQGPTDGSSAPPPPKERIDWAVLDPEDEQRLTQEFGSPLARLSLRLSAFYAGLKSFFQRKGVRIAIGIFLLVLVSGVAIIFAQPAFLAAAAVNLPWLATLSAGVLANIIPVGIGAALAEALGFVILVPVVVFPFFDFLSKPFQFLVRREAAADSAPAPAPASAPAPAFAPASAPAPTPALAGPPAPGRSHSGLSIRQQVSGGAALGGGSVASSPPPSPPSFSRAAGLKDKIAEEDKIAEVLGGETLKGKLEINGHKYPTRLYRAGDVPVCDIIEEVLLTHPKNEDLYVRIKSGSERAAQVAGLGKGGGRLVPAYVPVDVSKSFSSDDYHTLYVLEKLETSEGDKASLIQIADYVRRMESLAEEAHVKGPASR